MRSIVALLVVGGLAVAGWLVWLRMPAGPRLPEPSKAGARMDEQAPPDVPKPVEIAPRPTPVVERTAESVAPNDEGNVEERLSTLGYPSTSGDLVEGSVIVVDAQGVEHGDANGSFNATIWSKSFGTGAGHVSVTDGSFTLHVPRGHQLGIDELELDHHFAVVDHDRLEIEAGTAIEVRAAWSRTVRLHVVDSRTRQELPGVTVVTALNRRLGHETHPGMVKAGERLTTTADSPLELEARSDGHYVSWEPTLFVTAPGYAWSALEVDYKVGGELTIELVPGACLEVTIAGVIPPLPKLQAGSRDHGDVRPMLRLWSPIEEVIPSLDDMVADVTKRLAELTDEQLKERPIGRRPTEEEIRAALAAEREQRARFDSRGWLLAEVAPEHAGPTRIEGIAPGRLIVALERGNPWDHPQVLAEAHVEIVSGIDAHATLTIEPPRDVARRVQLAGSVYLSEAWGRPRLNLHFEPVAVPGSTAVDEFELDFDDLRSVPSEPGLYRFDAGEVLPGRYLVKSYSYEFQQVVDTGPDGTESAQIVIGDPVDVVVHALDDLTGSPIRTPRLLLWNCKRPEESSGGSLDDLEWNEEKQAWCCRAPAGEIELCVNHELDEFEPIEPSVFVVRPGHNELTVRMRRATGVMLSLELDGIVIDWPEDTRWSIALAAVDGSRCEVTPAFSRDDVVAFRVPAPGRWRVTVPPLAGYEAVAPFEITLERGVMLKRSIALRRSR